MTGIKEPYQKVYAAAITIAKRAHCENNVLVNLKNFVSFDRSLFHEATERNKERAKTNNLMRLLNIWCEGTFGIMKQSHNLSKTYKRGIRNGYGTLPLFGIVYEHKTNEGVEDIVLNPFWQQAHTD